MRRPFAWLCAALVLLSVIKYAAASPEGDAPLLEAVRMLQAAAGPAGELVVAGNVTKCSAVSSGTRLSVNHLTILRKDRSEQILLPRLILTMTTEQRNILPGDGIEASGRLRLWESAANPGQFDAQEYYHAQNAAGMLAQAEVKRTRPGGESLSRILYCVRRALGASFETILAGEQARIAEAVCLGEKELPGQEWKEFYQEGGIAHILAVSGLHISLVGMCLYRLLRRAGAPFALCCAFSGTAVVLYGAMTGFGVSAARAVMMFCLWLGAQLFGRKYDMVTAAAAAAAAVLLTEIRTLSQASFFLSFGAVLVIAVLLPCLEHALLTGNYERKRAGREELRPGGRLLRAMLSCAGIWFGTLPVTLYFFYQTAPWSILLNLAVVPLMSALMAYGLLSALAGLVWTAGGMFLAAPVSYILGCFEFLCRIEQRLPLPVWVAGRPPLWCMLAYYGLLALALLLSYWWTGMWRNRKIQGRQHRRKAALCALWLLCAASCIGLMCVRGSGAGRNRLEIVCLDVGQGDAALLRLPGNVNCLIDGGSSSESGIWRYRIGQAARYYGARTLEYVFLSHADRDHISGITEYLQSCTPGFAGENIHGVTIKRLVLPPAADEEDFQELCALAQEKGIRILRMEAGASLGNGGPDTVRAGQTTASGAEYTDMERAGENGAWSLTCLAPDASSLSGDRNEDSMVLMLQYRTFRMLFTGDLEGNAEQRLACAGKQLRADVLKVGHHGSGNASSSLFLEQVRPSFAVISCGKDNPYGHPADETLQRLEAAGCRILETPEGGAVMIATDGEHYTVESYRERTAADSCVQQTFCPGGRGQNVQILG